MHTTKPAPDVLALNDSAEVPGLGFLPINSFLVHAEQPMLIDTGLPTSREAFLENLWAAVDPADLRWVYLTHPDRDHTGSLAEVMAAAPQAKLVTTFMGYGIVGIDFPIPPDRVFLLNPGQSINLGDRTLTCFRPPVFDSPATTGLHDQSTGTAFTSDCFGAPMATGELVEDIADLPPDDLLAAQRLWVTVDSPWVAHVDRARFLSTFETLRGLDPSVVLSTHLPPARDAMPQLLEMLAGSPDADPFVGPDQAALEAMLAGFEPAH